MHFSGKSDIGLVRKTNEDSFISSPPNLFMVADGMGGHNAGDIASKLCTTAVKDHIQSCASNCNWQEALNEALVKANTVVWQKNQENAEYAGMGTTATAIYIEKNIVLWAHVGDTRLYHIRDGNMRQVTTDHSLVSELVEEGKITVEESIQHPNKNILTRAVGTSPDIEVDIGAFDIKSKDVLLLCSDGLTNMVSDEDILKTVTHFAEKVSSTVDDLILQANVAGGHDNITVIIVKCD